MGVILTNDYFYINGVRCDTVGLSCDTPAVPPMAAQSYTSWDTGKDMGDSTPDGTFANVSYTLTARVFQNPDDFDNSKIYEYLVNAKTLTISRLPDYFFKVRSVDGIQPTQKHDGNVIAYKVKFTLAPFKFFLDNSEIEASGTVENKGNRYCRPLYHITGLDRNYVTLTVNRESFTISGFDSAHTEIWIDAERLLVYGKSNINLMPYSKGQIPFLNTGNNSVNVTNGTLLITGNWRSY